MGDEEKEVPEPKRISIDKDLVEPEVPDGLITRPPIPEGLGKGWFLERPPLFLFARVLTDDEAGEIHSNIYSKSDGVTHKGDYAATVMELEVHNRGMAPFKKEQSTDFQLFVQVYEDPQHRKEPYNHSAHSAAEDFLGKDHWITRALDDGYKAVTIPPGQKMRLLYYFTKYGPTKNLLPEMMFRVYAGDWPLWPMQVMSAPPGYRAQAEGVVKVYLYRPTKGDNRYKPPEPISVERGIRFEALNEWDDKVEFISDHPLEVDADADVGFVRVLATVLGDDGLVAAGAINKFSQYGRDILAVTNPLPTWDQVRGPPKGPFRPGMVRRRWLMTTGAQRPLVAAEGETFAVAVEGHLWVFDARGELVHTFDAPWYPYSLCFGKGATSVYMGHDNTLVEFDLSRGKGYDLQDLPARIENLALRPDGSLLALSDSGLLMHVDTDGRTLGTTAVQGTERILCAQNADVVVAWNGYAKLQILDGHLKERLSSEAETYDGIALSPDGRYLAVGNSDRRATILDIDGGLKPVASFQTIGLAHTMAFHPKRPLLVVATRDSYLHAFDIGKGPVLCKRIEGYVANDMAYGARACVLSMIDGYIHALEFEEE